MFWVPWDLAVLYDLPRPDQSHKLTAPLTSRLARPRENHNHNHSHNLDIVTFDHDNLSMPVIDVLALSPAWSTYLPIHSFCISSFHLFISTVYCIFQSFSFQSHPIQSNTPSSVPLLLFPTPFVARKCGDRLFPATFEFYLSWFSHALHPPTAFCAFARHQPLSYFPAIDTAATSHFSASNLFFFYNCVSGVRTFPIAVCALGPRCSLLA